MKATDTTTKPPESSEGVELAENPRAFTLWQRAQILIMTWAGYLAVLTIGRSLRWEVHGWEHFESVTGPGKSLIYAFWHNEIFPATWFWRKRGIIVMTSQNFDGEYIGRIIRMHGYGAARGSSSRGGARALVEMIRAMRKGRPTAFTVDGPRGPRHVAKPGAVLLAKASGAPILSFHIALERAWTFRRSWDRTEIPRPFTRAAIFIAPPITVGSEADDQEQARKAQQVQATLDELVRRGQEWKLTNR
ncbi:MAG TPA: lysophospholipid acyltransferase family protein [Terriglobia bacterium]|nr:lysophospholipid acyltransferase family protein [Terriglobia bacterium]